MIQYKIITLDIVPAKKKKLENIREMFYLKSNEIHKFNHSNRNT